jgi:hypothetical protein
VRVASDFTAAAAARVVLVGFFLFRGATPNSVSLLLPAPYLETRYDWNALRRLEHALARDVVVESSPRDPG